MLQKTKGIVLRSIKYGETSVICTIFTPDFGISSYIVKGIRTQKARTSKASLLQPATLLELVVYHHPQKSLQFIKEFHPAELYRHIQEDVVKNAVALFSVELLFRLLPESAPLPELFEFSFGYFLGLDRSPRSAAANFPLYFITHCGNMLGYEVIGNYSTATPYLNLQEGGFSEHPPTGAHEVTAADAHAFDRLLHTDSIEAFSAIKLSSATRSRLLEMYITFLQLHSQHMGNIRSLAILKTVLHE